MTDSDDDQTQSFVVLTRGTEVAHYKIIQKIGAGGMGEVYLADDTSLIRRVALKFLPDHLCHDTDYRARFKREAQAAAKLSHPNIITVHEVGDYNERPYFVMEHIAGEALDDFMKGCDRSLERIIDLSFQVCDGLSKAHQAGIIHRDIKPSNILIDKDGRVKILDFGLATIEGTDKLTKIGSTLGTLHYMSPEQTRGEEVDQQSDIFSFGVVLYEMITGQLPFKGDHQPAILHAICYDEPEPLSQHTTGVPDELQRIVGKMLSKDKSVRYRHTDELLADLKRMISSIDHSEYLLNKPIDLMQNEDRGVVSSSSRLGLKREQSSQQLPIPDLPCTPKKAFLIAGFLTALVGIIYLTSWTPHPLRYYDKVTTSPADAEKIALSLLEKQEISLFGFSSHTYASENSELTGVVRYLELPSSDLEALEPWLPPYSYLTRVMSADGQERYDFSISANGTVSSFHHFLRPDIKPDTLGSDSARFVARRFSEDLLGIQLSNLKEMPVSVSKSAEGIVTSLQWVTENQLPGNAVAEVRASFVGSHLTSIRKTASFPEVVRKSIGDVPIFWGIVASVLVVLSFVLLGIIATKNKAWHFPTWKVMSSIAVPLFSLTLFMARPFYYTLSSVETADLIFAALLMTFLGFLAAVIVILIIAAAFGILERERPDLLSGLRMAPVGKIAGDVVFKAVAIGMVAGALAFIVKAVYIHLIMSVHAVELPPPFGVRGGTYLTEVIPLILNLISSIGVVSLAITSSVILGKYLRFSVIGWIFVAIVWANTEGNFLSVDGLTAYLRISNIIPVAVTMWIVSRYGLLAGILTWSGFQIMTSGVSLSSFATDHYIYLGYLWLGIWLLIGAISVYRVIKKAEPGTTEVTPLSAESI